MTNFVDAGFREVADRIWVARYSRHDVNVTLVGGSSGVLVVDTHASTAAGAEVIADIGRLGVGPVSGVVNTHWHFDHTFGNAAFRAAYGPVPIHAHETALEELVARGEEVRKHGADDLDNPLRAEFVDTELTVPDHIFSSAVALDLGDRMVELVHPGRGHTGGDLVVRVPDADVLLAGDLVEESAPPAFGADSYPLDWPHSLDIVLGLTSAKTVVVPGHGALVDREFVEVQRNTIGLVAETIRSLAARGVPVTEALACGEWAYPADGLADAVRRGYAQLRPGEKRLPLV